MDYRDSIALKQRPTCRIWWSNGHKWRASAAHSMSGSSAAAVAHASASQKRASPNSLPETPAETGNGVVDELIPELLGQRTI